MSGSKKRGPEILKRGGRRPPNCPPAPPARKSPPLGSQLYIKEEHVTVWVPMSSGEASMVISAAWDPEISMTVVGVPNEDLIALLDSEGIVVRVQPLDLNT